MDPTEEPSLWKARALILHIPERKSTEDSSCTMRTAVWAGPGYCPGAHHVPQQGTEAGFLRSSASSDSSCSHLPAGSCCRARGDTSQWQYLWKHTPPWNASCSSKLSAVPLLGTGHLMPQDAEHSPKCSCRQIPTQTTLEKNELSKIVWLMYKSSFTNLWKHFTAPKAFHGFQVDQ